MHEFGLYNLQKEMASASDVDRNHAHARVEQKRNAYAFTNGLPSNHRIINGNSPESFVFPGNYTLQE